MIRLQVKMLVIPTLNSNKLNPIYFATSGFTFQLAAVKPNQTQET